MFSSKQKTIKSMFSSKSVKKVEKVISKFFLFNEGIRRSEESRDIREADDDGEDGDDDGDGSDDNNGGNNAAYGETYGIGGSQ